jgi:hypothetical protein
MLSFSLSDFFTWGERSCFGLEKAIGKREVNGFIE